MDSETEVRARRQGLLDAVNSRDLQALKGYLDPSFVAIAKYKVLWFNREGRMGYDAMLAHADRTFRLTKEFREEVRIEAVEINGSTALLTTTLIDEVMAAGVKRRTEQPGTETWKLLDGEWKFVQEVRYYSGRPADKAEGE